MIDGSRTEGRIDLQTPMKQGDLDDLKGSSSCRIS